MPRQLGAHGIVSKRHIISAYHAGAVKSTVFPDSMAQEVALCRKAVTNLHPFVSYSGSAAGPT